ncbi:glycerophosphoryl diester phosphodiesterase [Chitinophaga sp.]|uniref:glycerophosphoryl diester phosphodiesterase n=1 Tax=Chitinophaga sp. TaxID=1869181 RepID=UPI00261A8564|nr:glycerophosphoryl diester phosphodiesterase [uncultured Chitinophaga sp.]
MKIKFPIICALCGLTAGSAAAQERVSLESSALRLGWTQSAKGYALQKLSVKRNGSWMDLPHAGGEYTLLFSAAQPPKEPQPVLDAAGNMINFPESIYRYVIPLWKELTGPVQLNTAGEALHFYPSGVKAEGKGQAFASENARASMRALWQTDPAFPTDVTVTIQLTAKTDGYFSIATPTLATWPQNGFAWAGIPGYYQSNAVEKDFIKSAVYMQGIPDKPLIVRDRAASTLSPFIEGKNRVTLAVTAAPGTARDPWADKTKTQTVWRLGLSLMNRKGELTPTLYHPVLGEEGSYLQRGQTAEFSFRYTLQDADWYQVYKHAVNDIYRFPDFLALKSTKRSLTDRILAMHRYVTNDSTSLWRTEDFNSMKIGAQAYLGGVHGSEKDAMKNSDYGAMWMLAGIMNDPVLKETRLPYARNFKLQQQTVAPGFFHGAAAGQYYLSKSKRFTEEWGPYVEPIGTTYYVLMDAGNILLFNPGDAAMKKEVAAAAERLLGWMDEQGRWQVAYDQATQAPIFREVEDLRPTFYGLLIAYKILRQSRYLEAARKGADWFVRHAVDSGRFLGVCGDTRFAPDFATAQSAQALLELYEVTKEEKYRDAAIKTAKMYTTSIFTHPIPNGKTKWVNGVERKDWEISQAGLSFEHGGTFGSANYRGPILLASHAGMFVRMFALTKDSLFLHMARAAALGRDAFVDDATGVASYYWDVMNKGAGPYPHHAWWQIGWITDYLLAEAEMRSGGKVVFPRGFITPKVGPHQSYGFAPGKVNGKPANLMLRQGLIQCDNPYLDYYCALSTNGKQLFLILLNNDDQPMSTTAKVDFSRLTDKPVAAKNSYPVQIAPYGIQVVEISLRK